VSVASKAAWAIAGLTSVAVHAALALTFDMQSTGADAPPAGPPVSIAGSLESVLGAALAVSATPPEKVVPVEAEPVDRPTPASFRTARPVPPAEVRSITADPVAALASADPAPFETVEPLTATPVEPPADKAVTLPQPLPAKNTNASKRARPARPQPTPSQKRSTSPSQNRPGSNRPGNASANRGGGRGSSAATAGAIASYGARVRARILSNRPAAYGAGRVVITFAITSGGGLHYARLARSSGNAALDRAAIAAVRRAAPFPPPPAGSSPPQLTFSIPFSFR